MDVLPTFILKPLAFLFVLTVVIFVHELGHFLVARWCGVKVKTFSIGFGKEIFGFFDRYGTRWRLAWIPLGGYVKFMDDENGASVPSRDALQRMTPAEALKGATLYAARAIGLEQETGSLEPGKSADFALIDAPDVTTWLYHFQANACAGTWIRGQRVA